MEAETIRGEIEKTSRGFAFILHEPDDVFIPAALATALLTGDIVTARVHPKTKKLIQILKIQHTLKKFIGRFHQEYDAKGRKKQFAHLEDKLAQTEVLIRSIATEAVIQEGDKVLVEITQYQPRIEGKILRSFGPELAPKDDTFAVVVRSQWPQEFSEESQNEAKALSRMVQEAAKKSNYAGRKDLRHKHFITIDGKDARDFDDAICVEKTKSGYVLWVAIADVAEFVRPKTTLDQEAYERATSVYFPEWVIPMLPEVLSNGACSLRPNEEKLTLTCEMHFDLHGHKRSKTVYESVICSKRRCIYEEVQGEKDQGESFWTDFYELFQKIRENRFKRGSLDLDLPETKIILDEHSDTIDIQKVERVAAHMVIEEFMIAANESVTEIMEKAGWPFIYRIHETPKEEALERFSTFAQALGLKPEFDSDPTPKEISVFLKQVRTSPFSQILYYLLLRSLKQARYHTENLNHFGLASTAYTHFTSPIRRYPDLMVHRLLKRYLRHEKMNDEKRTNLTPAIESDCDHCSKQERKAEMLSRQVLKVKKARFMAKLYGEKFSARITNVSEMGVFVELEKWFIDGLIPMGELEGDYFEFIDERLMIKGKRTGKKFKIGDAVQVTLLRLDLDSGNIDFTLVDDLKDANPKNRPTGHKRR